MALEIKLGQKLGQSLVMTPQLQQAIKLLQLGRLEYLEVLAQELEKNPVLEDARMESGETSGEETLSKVEATTELPSELSQVSADKDFSNDVPYEDLSHLYSSHSGGSHGELPSLEATHGEELGLTEHLLWQLNTSEFGPEDREIAARIIGNLDRDGYLRVNWLELVQFLGCSEEQAEKVLGHLKTFDPVGVFARSISECLQIQLENIGQTDGLASAIVANHLNKLENKQYQDVARAERVAVEEVYDAIRLIRQLEPRPARCFVDEPPVFITPDVYVKVVDGEVLVTLNENGLPKLRLSKDYEGMLANLPSQKGADASYLKESVKSASWLIKSIQQRHQTIFKVSESIFRFQREFLDHGVTALKPLVLREVAEEVEMHESTISRVTTNKYVHTAQGVFELKFFFSSGVKGGDGEVSSESVKNLIKKLISTENQKKPLSDQAIVNLLKEEDVSVARRTVAKYRESLGILSSSKRKKVF